MERQKIIKWVGLGAVSALLVAIAVTAWHKLNDNEAPSAAKPAGLVVEGQKLHLAADAPQRAYLKIDAVQVLPVPLSEPLNGRIAYDDDVTARIFPAVAGRVLQLKVQAGDKVRAGDLLALVDAPDFAQAVADRQRAEADLRTKEAAFKRAQILRDGEVLAQKDFESAENDFAAANAEATRARARYRNLAPGSGNAEHYTLRAPFAGIVTERQANPGTEVRPDQANPLFVVSDPTRVWALAEVTEKDLGKVRVGQPVTVTVDAYPGQRFPATIKALSDVLDPQTRRVQLRCEVKNDKRLLKPEMFARIVPENTGQIRPRVPNTALISEGLHTFVFVESAPGVLEKKPVRLAFRGQEESFIEEGLNPGDRIVTAGTLLLNAELSGN